MLHHPVSASSCRKLHLLWSAGVDAKYIHLITFMIFLYTCWADSAFPLLYLPQQERAGRLPSEAGMSHPAVPVGHRAVPPAAGDEDQVT